MRRLLGLILALASLWLVDGRYASMAHEVKGGRSWAGVLSDVEYLIPGGGAILGLLGGVLALAGRAGRIPAVVGVSLVLLFIALVGGMSGQLSMIQPFLGPAVAMLGCTIGVVAIKNE